MINKIFCLVLLANISLISLHAQEVSLKEMALDAFKKENYNEAVAILEDALKESPNDPEIYYYLGFFNHYRAYDSRPLSGYDYAYSERIFGYLSKAIELSPDYGDAKYFYGAECSGNAFVAMQNYRIDSLRYFYNMAGKKGAYPPWLKELGKNMLQACDENAILFTGGNADFDICSYLQLIENYRTDITLIPIGNIDRPWYVKFLKTGLKGGVKAVNLNLTEAQILDIHPFKWDASTIVIPVSEKDKIRFNLPHTAVLEWEVAPDLFSERMHSKIESEKAKPRTYLSPQRAMLVQIVEDNFAYRPIYFSNFASPSFYGGLDSNFQNCGLISKLLPFSAPGTGYELDTAKLEQLFQKENLQNYKSVKTCDIPRISGIGTAYYHAMVLLAGEYNKNKEISKLREVKDIYNAQLKIGFRQDFEEAIWKELNKDN